MGSVEATLWEASMRLDPLDPVESGRADVRHALMAEYLGALMAPQAKRRPTAGDHLAALPWRPDYVAPAPPTPAVLRSKINAAMRALGGVTKGAR